jgi:phosphate-selective porin OprO/OprP
MKLSALVALALVVCSPLVVRAGVEELTIGGRFMQDYTVWGSVDDELEAAVGGQMNGTEVRRARLFASGLISSNIEFKVNWDFADGDETALKDAYLEITGIPGVGNARVGHFNEPFCLDELTSSKYISFLERASVNVFAPGRNSGVMLHDSFIGDRFVWQAGAFRTTDDAGLGEGDDGVSFGARVAGLVMGGVKDDNRVHIGVSVNSLAPECDEVRFRQRPEVHMSERFVDTDAIAADSVLRLGGEVGATFGPLHFSGEYIIANVTAAETEEETLERGASRGAEDSSFSGFYAQAGYFLTGETRAYKEGQWQRTKPARNLMEDGGLGAFEVVARYSSLDLNDKDAGVAGGKMDDITLGLNWYMHGNARWMINYVISTVSDGDAEEIGTASALITRFQFDF